MKLNDTAIRNAKPNGKTQKLFDGGGLFLTITSNGRKGWRLKYRFQGKEKLISFGNYPTVSLKSAREQREEAKGLLIRGIDPSRQRKMAKVQGLDGSDNSFEYVATEWFDNRKKNWSEIYQDKVRRILERKLYPWIGQLPLGQITPPILLEVLRKTEKQGKYDTAMVIKQIAGQVFRYGVATSRADRDITTDLKGALTSHRTVHRAAITDPKKVGRLMLAIEGYEGTTEVCSALKLASLTFVRPGELRRAEWSEINWDDALWVIPADKMKMREDHIVPLSRQSLEVLRYVKQFTGKARYIFSIRSTNRPMSENTILTALRIMGYPKDEMSGHGFRAMARTLLDEQLKFRIDWIEQQLAHAVKDPLGRAYNRTKHLDERGEMMQAWADYLDELKEKARDGQL